MIWIFRNIDNNWVIEVVFTIEDNEMSQKQAIFA